MEVLYIAFLLLLLVLVVWVIMLHTADAERRGFSRLQVFLIRAGSFIFFPFGFFAYLILRPSIKGDR